MSGVNTDGPFSLRMRATDTSTSPPPPPPVPDTGSDGEPMRAGLAAKFNALPSSVRDLFAGPVLTNDNPPVYIARRVCTLHHNGWTTAEAVELARHFPVGFGLLGQAGIMEAWEELDRRDAKREQAKRQSGRLRILDVNDLLNLPPRDYIVKGWLAPAEISLLVGAKNTYKTFLALHVGYAVAQERKVFGRRVKQVSVLYVVCEGEAGIAKRVTALARRNDLTDGFHIIAQPVDLLRSTVNEGDLHDLVKAAHTHRVGLIIVDTVARVLAGSDEGAADMGTLLNNLSLLRAATGAHILGVHHGTKTDGTSSRGHSNLPNGADAIAQVEWNAVTGTGSVTLGFSRDDATGPLGAFRTEPVELGADADGDEITTLLVNESDPAGASAEQQGKKLPGNAAAKAMWDVVTNLMAREGAPIRPKPDVPQVTGVPRARLREELIEAGWFHEGELSQRSEPYGGELSQSFTAMKVTDAGYMAENNALRSLRAKGFLAYDRHHVWPL